MYKNSAYIYVGCSLSLTYLCKYECQKITTDNCKQAEAPEKQFL